MIATRMSLLGLERRTNKWVHTGSLRRGRKICTLIAAMIAGATHIDRVHVFRAGAAQTVLPFRGDGPSTLWKMINSSRKSASTKRPGFPVRVIGVSPLPFPGAPPG